MNAPRKARHLRQRSGWSMSRLSPQDTQVMIVVTVSFQVVKRRMGVFEGSGSAEVPTHTASSRELMFGKQREPVRLR